MTTNGSSLQQLAQKNGYPPPEQHEGHTCQACGAPVACEWRTVAEARRRARAMVMLANQIEARLAGVHIGAPRKREFTTEEALRLFKELGSYNAVAVRLGVSSGTIQRTLLPREQWTKAMRGEKR